MDTTKIANYLAKRWVDLAFVLVLFFTSCCFIDYGRTLFFCFCFNCKTLKTILSLALPACATAIFWTRRKNMVQIGDTLAFFEAVFCVLYIIDCLTLRLAWNVERSFALFRLMYGIITFFSSYSTCVLIAYINKKRNTPIATQFATMSKTFFMGFVGVFVIGFVMSFFVIRTYSLESININLVPTQGEFRRVFDNGIDFTIARDFGNVLFFTALAMMNMELAKKHKVFWSIGFGALVSIGMELFQYITRCGDPDVDDVIANILGALLGYVLYKLVIDKIKKPQIEA